VNLSIFSIPDLSQIKDLAGMKIVKTGKIHILYEPGQIVISRCIFHIAAAGDFAHPVHPKYESGGCQ
jgi:hypothetical protein